jgi:hypothetical protein
MGKSKPAGTLTGTRTRPWLITSAAAIGWGIVTMTILHLISSHNPVFDTLSNYAFTDRGGGMFEASVLSLSIGSSFSARFTRPWCRSAAPRQRFFPPGHSASRPPRSFPPVTPHPRIRYAAKSTNTRASSRF